MTRANPAFRFTAVQDELLQVALRSDGGAPLRWAAFCRHSSPSSIDHKTRRLLPLVEHQLRRAQAPTHLVERSLTRSALRDAAASHAARTAWLTPLVARLGTAGIDVMVLKGAALAARWYEHPALRPMVDVDLLVRPRQLAETLDELAAVGFDPKSPQSSIERRGQAMDLRGPAGEKVDLHWRLHPALADALPTDELFARAVPLTFDGADTCALDPTDDFLHLLVHGATNGWRSHPLWVADAVTLIERGPAIDGSRLRRLVAAAGVGYPVAEALAYLAARFRRVPRFAPGPDPVGVIADIARLGRRPSLRQQRLYAQIASGTSPPAWLHRVLGPLAPTYHYWATQTISWSRTRAAREAPGWLADHWALDGPADLPRAAWERARGRISRLRP